MLSFSFSQVVSGSIIVVDSFCDENGDHTGLPTSTPYSGVPSRREPRDGESLTEGRVETGGPGVRKLLCPTQGHILKWSPPPCFDKRCPLKILNTETKLLEDLFYGVP